PQLTEVVDLAVEDDPVPRALVAHRLATGGQIDDRQASHSQTDVACSVDARVVRPSVLERAQHRGQELACGRADVAGDAAHQRVTAAGALAATPPAASRRSASTRPVVRAGV